MHSVIYSRKNRETCMKRYVNDTNNTRDWDMLNNLYSKNRYTYYTPLCYQLFEDTDNSNSWGKFNLILITNKGQELSCPLLFKYGYF